MDPISLKSFEDTEVAFAYKSNWGLKKAHYLFLTVKKPIIAKLATWSVKVSFLLRLPVKGLIKKTVFDHFCGGETIADSQETVNILNRYGVGTILDYSVEGEHNEEGFDHTADEVVRTIKNANGNSAIPFCAFKVSGIAPVEIFEKAQYGDSLTDEETHEYKLAKSRIERLCSEAHENNVPIFIDAEDSWYQDVIDSICYEMMEKFNKERAIVFNTFQMYRRDMLDNLKNSIETARLKKYFFGAKLVRGAYMEKERERAEEMGYADPICVNKEATDTSFNSGLEVCIKNFDIVSVVNCSHNDYSNFYLTELLEESKIDINSPKVYFAQLYGMSDNITFNLSKAGYNVAKYVPYGPIKSVMPYLFRRADENTSVAGQSSRELALIKKEMSRRKKLK